MRRDRPVRRAETLADLRESYRTRLKGKRSRAADVIDLLFVNPVMTVRHVQQRLGVSQPGAANLLRVLTDLGITREVGVRPGVRHRWFADGILEVLDPDLATSATGR